MWTVERFMSDWFRRDKEERDLFAIYSRKYKWVCARTQYLKLLSLFLLSDSGHGIAQVCRHGDHPQRHVAWVSLHARWRSRRWPLKGGPAVKESPSRMDQWEEGGSTGSYKNPSTTTQPCTWAPCILVRCHHWNTFLLLIFIHSFMSVYVCT